MPELPEVEAARRAIEDHCIGKKIKKSAIANDPKVIDGVLPSDFEASLLGKTIIAAHRKGKNMWLQLDSPPFPSFQFGMAGAVYIKGVAVTKYKRSAVSDTDEWPSKYSKLFIELDDGLELSFTDKRRFAKVRLLKDPASVPPISELGPDALLEPMQEDEFIKSLSKKKIGIKALLLDQGFISGIGNWIADEVLYQARIHPLQVSASISKEGCVALQKCIKEVIQYAVEVDADCSRFSLEWLFHFRWGKKPGKVNGKIDLIYVIVLIKKQFILQVIEKAVGVGADSSQFPSTWIFHSREKKPGKAFVDGKKIEFIAAGGRTTAFVPELQKLTGVQAAKAPGRHTKQAVKESKDEVEDDVNEPASEEDENLKSVKSKGGRKTARRGHKKPTAKRKFSGSDEDEGDSDDDDGGQKKKTMVGKNLPTGRKSKRSDEKNNDGDQKRKTRGPKKPPAEENSEESGDHHDNSGSDDEKDGGEDHKQVKKVGMRKNTRVEKTSKEKFEGSQKGKQLKKRAK